jgi:hypothetical protein
MFSSAKIIGLRCNEVVAGLGAIHCVTQQQPAARFWRWPFLPFRLQGLDYFRAAYPGR